MGTTYVSDSGLFIYSGRYYKEEFFPKIWAGLRLGLQNGSIISHETVMAELLGAKAIDEAGRLVGQFPNSFVQTTARQVELVGEILAAFPNLISPDARKNQADPWVVAVALEIAETPNLFGTPDVCVVSTEKFHKGGQKIPNVCESHRLRHINQLEMFRELDLL